MLYKCVHKPTKLVQKIMRDILSTCNVREHLNNRMTDLCLLAKTYTAVIIWRRSAGGGTLGVGEGNPRAYELCHTIEINNKKIMHWNISYKSKKLKAI